MSLGDQELLRVGTTRAPLFPGGAPLIGLPAAFVHLDEVEVGDDLAIIREAILLDHVRDEAVSLIITPAAFAHEAVVDEDLFIVQATTVGFAPFEDFGV